MKYTNTHENGKTKTTAHTIKNLSISLFVLAIALLTVHATNALTDDATISVQPNTINITFNTNIWGTNFDNGFSQRGDPAYCKGRDLFNETVGITKRTALGQTYARVWITRQALNITENTTSLIDWTFADKVIADSYANNVTPILVICGYGSPKCAYTYGNDSEYNTMPNRTAIANLTAKIIDRYSITYDTTTWFFEWLNEPWGNSPSNGAYGATDVSYANWWSSTKGILMTQFGTNYSTRKFGANCANCYDWINTINRTYEYLEIHGYGEDGDPTLDSNDAIMNKSWQLTTYNQFSCQKYSKSLRSQVNVTCVLGEYNWHSGVNGSNTSDLRQDTNFISAWTASAITTFLNASSGDRNIFNMTFQYDDTNCDFSNNGLGLYTFDGGQFNPTTQYEVFQYIKNYAKYTGNIYTHLENNSDGVGVAVIEGKPGISQYFIMIVNRKNATSTQTITGYAASYIQDAKTGAKINRNADYSFTVPLSEYEVKYLILNNSWSGSENEGCVSFEPLGSCPETSFPLRPAVSYTNTIREDSTGFYFDYNGTDMNITYKIKKNTGNVSGPWSPFSDAGWNYTVDSQYGHTEMDRPSNMNPAFWFTNGSTIKEYAVGSYFGIVYRNITFQTISGNGAAIWVNYTLVDKSTGWSYLDSELVKYNITIKGKSLNMEMIGQNGKFSYLTTTNINGFGNKLKLFNFDNSSFATVKSQDVVIINNQLFYNIAFILDKSEMSEISRQDNTVSNATVLNYKKRADFLNLTNGSRNILNMSMSFIVSDKILDTTLNSKYSDNAGYENLKDKWFIILGCSNYVSCPWNNTKKLYDYGFDTTRMIAMFGQVGLQKPDFSNYTSPNTKAIVYQAAQNITSLGGWMVAGIAFQDVNILSPFYNDTNYNGIFINATNYSMLVMETNSSFKIGYNSQYVAKYDRRIDIYNYLKNNLSDWGMTKYMFIDTEGANTVKWADENANSSIRGRLSAQFPYRKAYFDQIKTDGRYVCSENYEGFWTVGLVNCGPGEYNSEGNASKMGIFPNWDDTTIVNKQVRYSSRLLIWMNNWNVSSESKYVQSRDEFDYDKRIVAGIIKKERPMLDSFIATQHNISDNLSILQYFAMDKITLLKYQSTISNRSFYNSSNGRYETGDEWAAISGDFTNVLIFEEWSNGLRVYANLNRTGWWNLTINGALRSIPPNGLYAYTTDGSFSMFYNADNLSTYIITEDYVYLYPKNDQEVTFDFPLGWYDIKKFYGDDSTNGLRLENTLHVSTITSKNVLLLTPSSTIDPNYPDRDFWMAIAVIIVVAGLCLIIWHKVTGE